MLALLVLVTASIQPRFLNLSNIQFILVDTTIFALLAVGETMVVLTRNVDLSIGSVLGLSAFLSADLFQTHPGMPIPVVFLAGIGIGIACGVVIGLVTVVGQVPSLVVTLAALYVIRGIDVLIVGGGQVVASSLPNGFIEIPKKTVEGIPVLAIVIAAVVVGGVAIFGGSGSVVGAALGALLLNAILTALYVLGVSPFWNQAIAGGLLLGAIALDRGISLRLAAILQKKKAHLGA